MMKVIFTLVVIFLGLRLFWQLFGVSIARWVLLRLSRRMQQDFIRQQNAQEQNSTHYDQEIHLGPNLKVKVPPQARQEHGPKPSPAIEDVEFEEVP